jgi:hypothetical protein
MEADRRPKSGFSDNVFRSSPKAHSGWAALVVLGKPEDDFVVVDRRRIPLVEEEWAKQPYHAAGHLTARRHGQKI